MEEAFIDLVDVQDLFVPATKVVADHEAGELRLEGSMVEADWRHRS